MCNEIPEHEWSGILIYKIVGSFNTGNFHCVVKDIFPMNVGSSTYTEYEFNADFIKYRMDNPDSLDMEVSHIHSHAGMPTFFSGTDMQELQDNVPNHNYYLSLIVNNVFEPTAKIAFIGEQEVKEDCVRSFVSDSGKIHKFKTNTIKKEEVLFIYNCKIEYDLDITTTSTFNKRVEEIIQAKAALELKKKTTIITSDKAYQSRIPYTEFEDSYAVSKANKELTEEDIEKLLSCALTSTYNSESNLEEFLFRANKDFLIKKDKYITEFGNFFRSILPLYLADYRDELNQEETLKVIEVLMFHEDDFEELINNLVIEIMN